MRLRILSGHSFPGHSPPENLEGSLLRQAVVSEINQLTVLSIVLYGSDRTGHDSRIKNEVTNDVNRMFVSKGTGNAKSLSSRDKDDSDGEKNLRLVHRSNFRALAAARVHRNAALPILETASGDYASCTVPRHSPSPILACPSRSQ